MLFDMQRTPTSLTLEKIAELIETVSQENQRILDASRPSIIVDVTPFHSRDIPPISIKRYIERVAKFVALDNDALLALVVYLDRIVRLNPGRVSLVPTPFNIHRLLISAIVIAQKFNSDIFFNNARYSKVGGIPLAEMNQLELEMLFLIRFELKVEIDELQQIGDWLFSRSSIGEVNDNGINILQQQAAQSILQKQPSVTIAQSLLDQYQIDLQSKQAKLVISHQPAIFDQNSMLFSPQLNGDRCHSLPEYCSPQPKASPLLPFIHVGPPDHTVSPTATDAIIQSRSHVYPVEL